MAACSWCAARIGWGRIDHVPIPGSKDQVVADPARMQHITATLEIVHAELELGDAVIFHCNTLHQSAQNRSPDRRWTFLCCYNLVSNDTISREHGRYYVPLETVPDGAIKAAGSNSPAAPRISPVGPSCPKSVNRPRPEPSSAPMFSLRDRVALVTGASRGLGAEIALGLARAGAHVLLNSRDAGNLAPQIARIAAAGGHATALAFDVGDAAAIEQAFTAIEREHGRLDVLVSNVGTRKRGPLEALSRDDLSAMLAVNLTASFDMGKRAAALMAPRSHGRIIMVTSIAGPRARVGDAAYITAKGGLEAMTRAFAAELGPRGITVNAIAPGYFATLTNQYLVDDPAVQAYVAQRIPLQRWAAPHEIAGAAVFLASDEASYVNGHVLIVDGGHTTTF